MDTPTRPVSPLRQRMLDDMRMRKLTPKTQSAYIRAVCRFTRYLGRAPDTATVEDLRNYQLHLVDTGTSPMSLNAAISGLKFFFDITLQRGELMARMQPVRLPQRLPRLRLRAAATRRFAQGNPSIETLALDGFLFFRRFALFDLHSPQAHVVEAVKSEGVGRRAVPARSTDLLVISFDTLWQRRMADEPHVGFVDPHAEGDRRGHHHPVLLQEGILMLGSRRRIESGMIGQCVKPVLAQAFGHPVGGIAGGAIDDAAFATMFGQKQFELPS